MCYVSSPSWCWRRPMKIGTPTSATTPSDSIDWLNAGYGNNPNSGCGCIDGGRYRTIQRDGAFQHSCARLSRDPLQNNHRGQGAILLYERLGGSHGEQQQLALHARVDVALKAVLPGARGNQLNGQALARLHVHPFDPPPERGAVGAFHLDVAAGQ